MIIPIAIVTDIICVDIHIRIGIGNVAMVDTITITAIMIITFVAIAARAKNRKCVKPMDNRVV